MALRPVHRLDGAVHADPAGRGVLLRLHRLRQRRLHPVESGRNSGLLADLPAVDLAEHLCHGHLPCHRLPRGLFHCALQADHAASAANARDAAHVHQLPAATGDRWQEAQGARMGGYTVMDTPHPKVVLVANGSEVALLCDVAVLLEAEGVPCRVVSVPSQGLFLQQDKDYRESGIPTHGIPVFGLTAGLPSTLRSVVGTNGMVYGLNHFGASAPYKVLDEKFGFTAQNVLNEVLRFIGK